MTSWPRAASPSSGPGRHAAVGAGHAGLLAVAAARGRSRLALLDAATGARLAGRRRVNQDIHVAAPAVEQGEARPRRRRRPALDRCPEAGAGRAAAALHAKEPTLTELDSLAGDGDLGASMKRAADAILAVPDAAWPIRPRWPRWAARCARPSPAVPAVLRHRAAARSRRLARGAQPSARDWAGAFSDAVQAVSDLGGAKAGDRTMLDALFRPPPPSSRAWPRARRRLSPSPRRSRPRSRARRRPPPWRRARPRQLSGERAVGAPDGGAVAVACWLACGRMSARYEHRVRAIILGTFSLLAYLH